MKLIENANSFVQKKYMLSNIDLNCTKLNSYLMETTV